ncbi:MAG: preprotein translocase subunit SecY [Chloroherpetonaceae bacterium]|nr:preprotein translocase subunit SecY [Chloroherpetonaceae bacterium]
MKLFESIRNIGKIEELKDRILYTIALLFIYRLGSHVTIPGVDAVAVQAAAQGPSNDLFGLFDLFVGGAFKRASVFALGIMPYISASIIIQLLGAVAPYFQKLQKEGEEGRKKINQYTRLGTVFVAALQAWGLSVSLQSPSSFGQSIVPDPGFLFTISTIFTLTAATVFTMWLGERITERGIGNGISLIIMIGILARFPQSLVGEWQMVASGNKNIIIELIVLAIMVAIIAAVVFITVGTRRIPVQYAKRVVNRKVVGGSTQYIPMKINTAGVMPIIFAQSIMFIPSTLISFFPESETMQRVSQWIAYDSWGYAIMFGLLIVFFTYFYTAIAFNPKDVADTMQKQGGFIPGVRPGKSTSDFIDNILTRITLPGAFSLALIAILPTILIKFGNVTPGFAQYFGGTSLLIIVGVALDTLQQIESHLLMRHYDGFMKSGRIKSRSSATA